MLTILSFRALHITRALSCEAWSDRPRPAQHLLISIKLPLLVIQATFIDIHKKHANVTICLAIILVEEVWNWLCQPTIDKAPRLSISIVIRILSSDTICRLNQFNTNSEAAMLSTWQCCRQFWPPGIRDNRGLIWSPLFWIWGAFVIIRSTILLLWVEKQLWLPGE